MKIRTYFLLCGLSAGVVLLLAFASLTQAAGRIVIDPKIHTGIQYNSNFWKVEDNETGVNTYYVKPGVIVGYETPKTIFHTDLSIDPYWYQDQDTPPPGTRDSSEDDFVGFTGLLNFSTQATDRFQLGLDDTFNLSRDPANSDTFNNATDREKFWINRFTPYVYYDMGRRSRAGLKYRNTATEYLEDLGGESSRENRGIFEMHYNLNSKSSIYADYQYWQRDYEFSTPTYASNRPSLNYSYTFNFFTFTAGVGYHHRSFDDLKLTVDDQPEQAELEDIDMVPWTIGFNGEEKVSDSSRKSRYWVRFDLSSDFNDSGSRQQYFIATVATLDAGYRFFNKLETSGLLRFQNSDYQESLEDRVDDTIYGKARVMYDLKDYLSIGIEGGVENRDSNLEGRSFDDTFVLGLLNFDYSFSGR